MKAVIFGLSVFSIAPALHAADSYWTSAGPYGGSVHRVTVVRNTPNTVYASSLFGDFFKSIDGGGSWQGLNRSQYLNGNTYAVEQDVTNKLYIFDRRRFFLYSTDGGGNWRPTGYQYPDTAPPGGFTNASLFDVPGVTNKMFLSLIPGGLHFSGDGGATFTPVVSSNFAAGTYYTTTAFSTLAVDTNEPNVILAGVVQDDSPTSTPNPSIYRSIDGGLTWNAVLTDSSAAPTMPGVRAISFGPGDRVYALVGRHLWYSTDNGAVWNITGFSVPADNLGGLAFPILAHPTDENKVFVASNGLTEVTLSGMGGVTAVSLNLGLTPNPSFTGIDIRTRLLSIASHPDFPLTNRLMLGTLADGFYLSTTGGGSWTRSNQGITAKHIQSLRAHPNSALTGNSARLYAGTAYYGVPTEALLLSTNGGSSWATANIGLQAYSIFSIAVDPTTAATPSGTYLYLSGVAETDTVLPALIRNGGLYKSVDGAGSWANIDFLPADTLNGGRVDIGLVRGILLDPRSCGSPPLSGPCVTGPLKTAYAIAEGRDLAGRSGSGSLAERRYRVVKSTEEGAPWFEAESVMGKLPDQYDPMSGSYIASANPIALAINPLTTNILYAGTYLSGMADIHNGMFKSIDGGANWAPINNGIPRYPSSTNTALDVFAIAISSSNPNTLWASVRSIAGTDGKIYKSTNGGMNWSRSDTGIHTNHSISSITVDATDITGNTLYATAGVGNPATAISDPAGVYKSTDGGATWFSISVGLGYQAIDFTALAIDPGNPALLHVGSSNGVWSVARETDSDLDGIPDDIEDTGPHSGDSNLDLTLDRVQPDVGSGVVLSEGRGSGCNNEFTTVISSAICTIPSPRAVDVQGLARSGFGGNDFVDVASGEEYQYPLDLIRFEIADCSQAVVDVTFHSAGSQTECPSFVDPSWQFRFFGPQTPGLDSTLGWHDFSSRAARVDATTWRLTLNANQFGSYRPLDTSILFTGGPAYRADRLMENGFE